MQPAPPDSSYLIKRRIFLYSLIVGALSGALGWVLVGFGGGYDLALPLIAAWFGSLGIGLGLGWLKLSVVEIWAFWGLAAFMGYNLWQNILFSHESGLWISTLWTGLVFVVVYTVFEPKAAWRVSVGVYCSYLLIGAASLVAGAQFPVLEFVLMFLAFLTYLLITRLVLWFRENAASLQLEADRLYQLANTDGLTGVANRRFVMESLKKEVERSQLSMMPLSLILLDIDRFKSINDVFGHEAGDRVLTHTAQLLQQHLRRSDLVGRWGGEEFVLLLPGTPASEAKSLADRLQGLLAGNSLHNLRAVTASFGVASLNPEDTADSLVSRADQAMYDCKELGGNRVKVSTRG